MVELVTIHAKHVLMAVWLVLVHWSLNVIIVRTHQVRLHTS